MNAKVFAAAALSSAALAAELSHVIVIGTPGLLYPEVDLGQQVNAEDYVRVKGGITPLGQRQQFLVGSELRERYVVDQPLLNADYVVGESYLQTPFIGTSIQSLQAQMMGLFPESDANNLNEWQQGNAVPPIEGADFSAWQKELGEKALPYGLNTFPIQQVGMRADLVLATNESNCAAFKKSLKEWENTYEVSAWNYFKETYPKQHDIAVAKGASLDVTCDYSHWAYLTNVKLQDADTWASIEKDCQTRYMPARQNEYAAIDQANSNIVTSGILSTVADVLEAAQTSENSEPSVLKYHAYQTQDPEHLWALAKQMSSDYIAEFALPDTSMIIIEAYKDGVYKATLNDELISESTVDKIITDYRALAEVSAKEACVVAKEETYL